MRAIGVFEFGGPEALQLIELDDDQAEPGEIRVRVHATAVSPTDTHIRAGTRPDLADAPRPLIPGMDVAGVIDGIGPDTITDLAVGDRVMAMVSQSGSHGGYRESIVLPADSVTRAPAGSTHAEASTLPMNALTARLTLDQLGLEPGATLAVTGAAGCYGGYVVQLAKADGLFVVADASETDEALVRQLGADVVVRRGPDVAERIREAVPGGVDGLADGSVQNEQTLSAIRDGGGYASVRGWRGNDERGLGFHRTWVHEYHRRADLLDRIREQVEAGQVSLRVASEHAAADAADAHRRLEAGGVRGRCVIVF